MRGLQSAIERILFASRWLLAPLYFGLTLLLVLVVADFFRELVKAALSFASFGGTQVLVLTLSLIDLALVAGLLVMVMLGSYENFVSRLDIAAAEKNIAWLGKLDAGSIKLKVAVAIVAISSINLLRAVLEPVPVPDDKLMWLVIVHLAFLLTAFALVAVDRLTRDVH